MTKLNYVSNEVFIGAWRSEESVWNIRCKSYRMREEKKKGYARLATKSGMSEHDVKSRINNLRTYYARELVKVNQGCGTYHSKWPHFESLQFLKDVMMSRRAIDAFDEKDDRDENDIKDFYDGSNDFNEDETERASMVEVKVYKDENGEETEILLVPQSNPSPIVSEQMTTDVYNNNKLETTIIQPSEHIQTNATMTTITAPLIYQQQPTQQQEENKKILFTDQKPFILPKPAANEASGYGRLLPMKRKLDSSIEPAVKRELKIIKPAMPGTSSSSNSQQQLRLDPEDTFGNHVANELRSITDRKARQYAKMKIQEILFKCQFSSNIEDSNLC